MSHLMPFREYNSTIIVGLYMIYCVAFNEELLKCAGNGLVCLPSNDCNQNHQNGNSDD